MVFCQFCQISVHFANSWTAKILSVLLWCGLCLPLTDTILASHHDQTENASQFQLSGVDSWNLHPHLCSCMWTYAGQGNQVLILDLILNPDDDPVWFSDSVKEKSAGRWQGPSAPKAKVNHTEKNSNLSPEITFNLHLWMLQNWSHLKRGYFPPRPSLLTTPWQQMNQIEHEGREHQATSKFINQIIWSLTSNI